MRSIDMSKVNIFVMNKDLEKVTSILYDLKLIHFFEVSEENFEKHEHEDISQQSHKLLELRSTINFLEKYHTTDSGSSLNDPISTTKEWNTRLDKVEKKILHLEDEVQREAVLKNLKVKPQDLDSKNFTIGFISKSNKSYLSEFTKKGIKFNSFKFGERIYFAVKLSEDEISFGFNSFYIPKNISENLSYKLTQEKNNLKKIEDSLNKIANGNLLKLKAQEEELSKSISILESKNLFIKTKNISVLSGFVPSSKVIKIEKKLRATLGDNYELEAKLEKKEAPVELNHNPLVGNFKELLSMYSLPRYKELDPTILIFMIFPIFYGFILGDFGYGLISLILFTIAKVKFKQFKEFISILQISSISSMIFGVLYGEYFGFEPHLLPFEFARSHHPETLLMFAVGFGLLHINLGVILGAINNIKTPKKAICDNLAWLVLQAGVGLLGYGIYSSISALTIVGSILLVFSLILIYMGHGFVGIMEVPAFFTNILSYARLMAVGLSSIAIAVLVNDYSVPLLSSGVLGFIGGVLLFTLGHVFNIALGNFESFLHTLRLHYVEFFTKFYNGGGEEYKPFGLRRKD